MASWGLMCHEKKKEKQCTESGSEGLTDIKSNNGITEAMRNWKGYGRTRSRLNERTVPPFA